MTDMSVKSPSTKVVAPIEKPMKARLLDAATTVFSERGYYATRVSDIVAHAGVAQGTFYLYHESKKAIFLKLVDGFFGHLLGETIGRHPATRLAGPNDMFCQIRGIWRTILTYCREHPGLTALVLQESDALGPPYRDHVGAHYERVVDAMAAYLREAIALGIVRPVAPEAIAWVVLGMVERAIYYAVFVEPNADLDALVDDLVRMELVGLLATQAVLD
ncbi:MAG: TetR/AcrR family transcriptional regulator [Parvibaculaceae bacterium]